MQRFHFIKVLKPTLKEEFCIKIVVSIVVYKLPKSVVGESMGSRVWLLGKLWPTSGKVFQCVQAPVFL